MNIECDTSRLNAKQRTDVWCETVRTTYGPIRVQPEERGENLFGYLKSGQRSALRFNALRYRGQSHHRTAADIGKLESEYISLTRPTRGALNIDYGGVRDVFEPGKIYLYNHAVPYYAKPPGEYEATGIAFPASALRQRGVKPQAVHALPASSHQAILISTFADQLTCNYQKWSDQEFSSLSEQFLDLVALFFFSPGSTQSYDESSVRAAHRQRALAFIHANFGDHTLSPAKIAQACGISVSYLHNLFKVTNTSVEAAVFAERLKHSKELLLSPQTMHLPIGTIAYMSGFAHLAHFSRAFRQYFGCSPRELRASNQDISVDRIIGR
jgi:AraC-like DNA-binding protein